MRLLQYLFWAGCLLLFAAPSIAQKNNKSEVADEFMRARGSLIITRAGKSSRSAAPLGLGCTIFKEDKNGKAVRVSPSQVFHKGDGLRLMIEPNVDGYLYVFHAENEAPTEMLFPDARLQDGRNRIRAHTPYEVPSSREANPDVRWFHFDERPAIEHFYIVLSRQPLSQVLTGDKLIAYCSDKPDDCTWKPSTKFWDQLLAVAGAASRESQSQVSGQALTEAEQEAVARGVGLSPGAPAPAKIRMAASPKARLMMMKIDLSHK